jgi:hypothetical protein
VCARSPTALREFTTRRHTRTRLREFTARRWVAAAATATPRRGALAGGSRCQRAVLAGPGLVRSAACSGGCSWGRARARDFFFPSSLSRVRKGMESSQMVVRCVWRADDGGIFAPGFGAQDA